MMGHCYVSISSDGVVRSKLEGPSFESLPVDVRQAATRRAVSFDLESLDGEGLGSIFPEAFGANVSETLLSMARKLFLRDPSDLSMHAALQMAMSRIKLHTCEELELLQSEGTDLGDLLCSHPLHLKDSAQAKFYYPNQGLAFLLQQMENWLSNRV